MSIQKKKKNQRSSSMWGFFLREVINAVVWLLKKVLWLLATNQLQGE